MSNPQGGWPGPQWPGAAPQPGYGPPQQAQGYGAPPQGVVPQPGYGAPPQGVVPQPGYGAPQGYPMMPAPAAPGAIVGGPSAFGFGLEPGERVIYCHQPSYTAEKVAYWICGVLLLIVLVGIIFIVMALRVDKTNPRAVIVTNRRIIVIQGVAKGAPMWAPLEHVGDITAERQKTGYGGGLAGMAIAAIANKLADGKAKFERKYWARAIAIQVVMKNGTKMRVPTKDPLNAGPFLAQCLFAPGFAEQTPPVACPL